VNDADVLAHIEQLVGEEHRLLNRHHGDEGLDATDHARLDEVKVQLDRCWDLLRQRRALEEFGQDPDAAEARPAGVVENYEQ
jgi:Protein of unknown function (DUF2630)